MKIYESLNHIPFLRKSFPLKVLLIAFVGIHVPLLSVIFILVFFGFESLDATTFFLIILGFTLLATAVTLYVVNGLLAPITLVKESLRDFISHNRVPQLPDHHKDSIGLLMSDTQYAIVQLDALFKDNKELLTLLSHDLRGSLSNIISAAGLMKIGLADEQLIESVRSSAQDQLEIFDRTIRTLKSQQLVIGDSGDILTIDISDGIKEVLERRHGIVTAKNINVTHDLSPIKANLPPKLLSKIFGNVLDNAVKFTPKDGKISIKSHLKNGDICISVTDSGVGFNIDRMKEIFQYNSPLSRSGTNKEESMGVGMYLCRKLLEKYEGIIEAHSEGEGQGATFTICIPMMESSEINLVNEMMN